MVTTATQIVSDCALVRILPPALFAMNINARQDENRVQSRIVRW